MPSKKQLAKLRAACRHQREDSWVTFKNGTRHLENRCVLCSKHFGYKKQHQGPRDPERIPGVVYDDAF